MPFDLMAAYRHKKLQVSPVADSADSAVSRCLSGAGPAERLRVNCGKDDSIGIPQFSAKHPQPKMLPTPLDCKRNIAKSADPQDPQVNAENLVRNVCARLAICPIRFRRRLSDDDLNDIAEGHISFGYLQDYALQMLEDGHDLKSG